MPASYGRGEPTPQEWGPAYQVRMTAALAFSDRPTLASGASVVPCQLNSAQPRELQAVLDDRPTSTGRKIGPFYGGFTLF
jgi:hypothetical protein